MAAPEMSTFAMVKRMLQVQFHRATMSAGAKAAYDALTAAMVTTKSGEKLEYRISVPAGIKPEDAQKALKLIRLESDPSAVFDITWEKPADPSCAGGCSPPRNTP